MTNEEDDDNDGNEIRSNQEDAEEGGKEEEEEEEEEEEGVVVAEDESRNTVTNNQEQQEDTISPPLHLLLDAGYGIPRESRPRQEKILAIAKQIANFLEWQLLQLQSTNNKNIKPAPVTVVGCCDKGGMQDALLERLKKLWKSNTAAAAAVEAAQQQQQQQPNDDTILPSHFSFARDAEHSNQLLEGAIYLSPDAPTILNPNQSPPTKVIVGLLIDRRVQINRSYNRSQQLQLEAKRWPMEVLADDYHPQEPLNVDTILEALQQWSWNSSSGEGENCTNDDTAFRKASLQAFSHHAKRHPARPKHR